MRRAQAAKAMENNPNPQATLGNSKFLAKLIEIPTVHASFGVICGMYDSVQGKKGFIASTLSMAKSVTIAVAEKLTPLAQKISSPLPLEAMDNWALKKLEIMEEKAPVVNKQPKEIMDDTVEFFTIKTKPAVDTCKYVSTAVCRTKLAQVAFDVTEYGLCTADGALKYVLPPPPDKDIDEENGECDAKQPEDVSERGVYLFWKAYCMTFVYTKRFFDKAQSRVETAIHTNDVIFQNAQKAVLNMLPGGFGGEKKCKNKEKKSE